MYFTKAIEIIKFPKDQDIVKEGDPGSGLYIVYEGEVSVITSTNVRGKDASVAVSGDVDKGSVAHQPAVIDEGDEDDMGEDESGNNILLQITKRF